MKKHGLTARVMAAALVLSLQALFIPVSADGQTASLSGTVLSSEDRAPLRGVRLHAGDPKTGQIYSSGLTGEDGSFTVSDLPAATYELAVESGDTFFVVGSPVTLAPGQTQDVNVGVNLEAAPAPDTENKNRGGTSVFNNPGVAAAIVIGAAFVFGAIINEVTKSEETASPS